MKLGRATAFVLAALWCALLVALQALFASAPGFGAFAPELALVLVLAVGRDADARTTGLLAFVAAGTRAALGPEPPLALFAGYLGAVGMFALLRRSLEVDRALLRAPLAAVAAGGLVALAALARFVRLPAGALDAPALAPALWIASGTFVAALVLPPWLVRLPGLAPLARRAR